MKRVFSRALIGAAFVMLSGAAMADATQPDPYLWLEDVTGAKALEFVQAQNARTMSQLEGRPEYASIRTQVRNVLDSKERIPFVTQMGDRLYNFWRDANNPRGVWRRTTWAEYKKPQPQWETVLDLDALARDEHENWVWSGVSCLAPDYARCALRLSRGGGDAVVIREFDIPSKRFVADGFNLPEAKSDFTWRDIDTAYIGTDFGPGSMTDSGYPRIIKRWKRGTPLAQAQTVFEGQKTDVSVEAWVDHRPGYFREGFGRSIAFYNGETYVLRDGKTERIDVPNDAMPALVRDWLIVRLRDAWTVGGQTYPQGALIGIRAAAFAAGDRKFQVLYAPSATASLQNWTPTRDALLLDVLDNVRSRVFELTEADGQWQSRELALPGKGAASVSAVDSDTSNAYWLVYEDFLTPSTLSVGEVGKAGTTALKSSPSFFDPKGLRVVQREAVSKDGTRVPYFVVGRLDAVGKTAGPAPTLLYGYGGFEVTMEPWYSGSFGQAWLARGGVFVLANIRGGGEFGPQWHQAAIKTHRQKAYDDFIAVAEDVERTGLTTRKQLGIMGGSNGGLLVGAVMVERPDLFGAVVCQVPLLDMKRYNKLLAGASWMAEYGDPDQPEDWAALSKYSPYQNVRADVKYPPVLFTTSTRDDRVHPGHARKMVARMLEQGHKQVLYYENTEGGHAGAANNEQRAKMVALEFTFLWRELSGAGQ